MPVYSCFEWLEVVVSDQADHVVWETVPDVLLSPTVSCFLLQSPDFSHQISETDCSVPSEDRGVKPGRRGPTLRSEEEGEPRVSERVAAVSGYNTCVCVYELGNLVFSTMWINLQMLMGDKVGKFSAGMPDVHLSICPISGPRRALIDSGDISIDVPPPQPRLWPMHGRAPDAIKDAAKMDREQNSRKTLIVIPEDRGPVLLLKDVFNGMPVHEEVLSNQVALIAQSICVLRPAAPLAGGAAACKLSTQLGFRG
ncbi:hypothetical protein Bbelb_205440 [Branchiostoma belcheri]|nr:hypothetical protein Bbelb_205440 [Branchiostoma belcheri]